MKKNVYMILMAALMVGCSTTDDDQLASDPIPMTLTATVGQQTRTTADNSTWAGTEQIAIMTTQAGETTTSVKKYSVDGNGNMTLATDENEPFYFRSSTETKDVSAWYPYSTAMPTEWTVQTDQSGNGYANSDLLIAPTTEVTYDGSLKFEHQTAKLTINLTDETESGVTGVTVYGGITPHKGTTTDKTTVYNALLAPQDLSAAAPLFYVTTPDNIYIYSLPSALTLDKAHDYVYNVTVGYGTMKITSAKIKTWDDNGSTDIKAEVSMIGTKTAKDAVVGDYYMSDGSLVGKDETLTEYQIEQSVGIVFCTDPDRIGDTEKDFLNGKVHGLVIAKKNAGSYAWGSKVDESALANVSKWQDAQNAISGFTDIEALLTYYETINNDNYPAFYQAAVFSSPCPNTTGWFLPSAGQWFDIIDGICEINTSNTNYAQDGGNWLRYYTDTAMSTFNSKMEKIKGDTMDSENQNFWASTESSTTGWAYWISFYGTYNDQSCITIGCATKESQFIVRPILAF